MSELTAVTSPPYAVSDFTVPHLNNGHLPRTRGLPWPDFQRAMPAKRRPDTQMEMVLTTPHASASNVLQEPDADSARLYELIRHPIPGSRIGMLDLMTSGGIMAAFLASICVTLKLI